MLSVYACMYVCMCVLLVNLDNKIIIFYLCQFFFIIFYLFFLNNMFIDILLKTCVQCTITDTQKCKSTVQTTLIHW